MVRGGEEKKEGFFILLLSMSLIWNLNFVYGVWISFVERALMEVRYIGGKEGRLNIVFWHLEGDEESL